MRVERAQREAWRADAPPLLQRGRRDAPGGDHTVRGDARDRVTQRQMGGDEYDAEPAGGQHHRDRNVTGNVREKLRDARKAIARRVERRLVDRSGDDRLHLAAQGKPSRGFDALRRDATGFDVARHTVLPAADDPDVRVERLAQCLADDLRPNPARIADGDSEARTRSRATHDYSRMSM